MTPGLRHTMPAVALSAALAVAAEGAAGGGTASARTGGARGSAPAPSTLAPASTVAPRPPRRVAPRPVGDAIATLRVPAFLLPIYRAAGTRYGVPWEVLAAINAIETDFGRRKAVSSAGAVGWMQFLPSTWSRYGIDADHDGVRDPADPVDAIFAAARYLAASGAAADLRGALFAYNHADSYVNAVLARAREIARTPVAVRAALAGIAGGRFPVAGPARWTTGAGAVRHGVARVYARPGAAAVAVADGRIVELGRSSRVGRYVVLEDAFGTRYTYAGLASPSARRAIVPLARNAGQRARGARAKLRLFAHPRRVRARRAGGLGQLLAAGVPVRGYSPPSPSVAGRRHTRRPRVRLRRAARVRSGTVLGHVARRATGPGAHLRFAILPAGTGTHIDPRPVLAAWRPLEAPDAFRPSGRALFAAAAAPTAGPLLDTDQWSLLSERLAAIPNPVVRLTTRPKRRTT